MGPPPRPIGLQQQYADRTYGFRDIQRTRTSAGSNVKASLRSSSFASVRASQRANTNENGTERRDLQGSNNGYGTPPGFGRPINGQQKLPIMPGNVGINEQQQQQQEEDSSPVPMTFAPRPIPVIINPVQQQEDPSPAPITNIDDEAQRPTPVIIKYLPGGIQVYADVVPITEVTQPERVVVQDGEETKIVVVTNGNNNISRPINGSIESKQQKIKEEKEKWIQQNRRKSPVEFDMQNVGRRGIGSAFTREHSETKNDGTIISEQTTARKNHHHQQQQQP